MKRCKICGEYVEAFHRTYELHEECSEQIINILERALRLALNSIPCDENECPIAEEDCSQWADLNDCERRLFEFFMDRAKEGGGGE